MDANTCARAPGIWRSGPEVEPRASLTVAAKPIGRAVPLQHFAHEQQADALSTLLRAEEGREQLARRHLAQAVAGIAITDSRTRPSSRANAGTTQQSCLTDLAAVAASQKISRTYDERYRELTRKIAGADFITSDYYDDGQINAVGLRRDPALTLTSSMLMDTSFAATILTWTRPLARQAHD